MWLKLVAVYLMGVAVGIWTMWLLDPGWERQYHLLRAVCTSAGVPL